MQKLRGILLVGRPACSRSRLEGIRRSLGAEAQARPRGRGLFRKIRIMAALCKTAGPGHPRRTDMLPLSILIDRREAADCAHPFAEMTSGGRSTN